MLAPVFFIAPRPIPPTRLMHSYVGDGPVIPSCGYVAIRLVDVADEVSRIDEFREKSSTPRRAWAWRQLPNESGEQAMAVTR